MGLGDSWVFPSRWDVRAFPGRGRNGPTVLFLWRGAEGFSEVKAALWGIPTLHFKTRN